MCIIRDILEGLYHKYNHHHFIEPDPLQFAYRYSNPRDVEIAAFLSATLAYGRVRQIEKNLNDLFSHMGTSPYAFVMHFGKAHRQRLNDFRHRFTTGQDISDLLMVLSELLREKPSIEKYFLLGYSNDDKNIIPALSRFCDSLYGIYTKRNGSQVSNGLKYLLASPARGSACKRLNLFLRWMVRHDEVDIGLWKSIDKTKLIVPVDAHLGRLSKILGLHGRKTISLSTAVKITENFTKIEPADPVKYDFALTRLGILDNCTGQYRKQCHSCELLDFCNCS